jgi:hypothetical protein
MSTTEQLKGLFDTFMSENDKFEKGNASAGTRARKALMEMITLIKVRRKEIQEVKSSRKGE